MSWPLKERFLNVILYWIVDLKLEFQCDIMILTKNLKRIHRFFMEAIQLKYVTEKGMENCIRIFI